MSFTRKGHPELARRIDKALRRAGLRVFFDERISEGDQISANIIDALARSMVLVVVYSRPYVYRNACQEELRRVFIAAEAEGDPSRRIIVVNPEDGNDHLAPAELRDARYVAASGTDPDLSGLIAGVRDRVASLPGPMSSIRSVSQPRWLPPRIPGTPGFTGRHSDLWRLHSTLRAVDFPLTHAASSGPAAVIAGMAGMGKTSLAHAYAWHFSAVYPGGVYLSVLTGAGDAEAAAAQQAQEVRLIAHSIGLPVNGADPDQVRVLMGEHIDRQPGPSLWIVDDLPPGLDPPILHRLVIPARRVRTIFTSRDAGYRAQAGLVSLGGLTLADATVMLKKARAIVTAADREAALLIAERLGGHPLALSFAAAGLRNRQGLRSYADYAASLKPGHDVLNLVAGSLRLLTPDERIVVDLAGVLGSQPLPAALIEAVLSSVTEPPADAGRALDRLESLALARRDATSWYVHPLISDAARGAGPPPVSARTLAVAAARGVLTLGATRLARLLAGAPALRDTEEAGLLRRLLAEHYESLGDVVQAAHMRRLLAAAGPGSLADLTAAALACNACGDYADAADLARRAIESQRTFLGLWAAADALDGLGRYGVADPLWRELDAAEPPSSIPPAQRVAYQVSRARAYLARGQTRAAASGLEDILRHNPVERADDATVHQVNSAQVQLAILCLQTSKASWAEAATTLERLHDSYRESAGPGNVLTLTIAVQRALILARVGKRNRESLTVVSEAVPQIETRLGRRHPLWLRCQYILGLLYLRENDFETARRLLETAWTGQKDVLGPLHPETLGTELEYACVLSLFDSGRSRRLITEVRHALPGVSGRKNFNYGRAFFASTLLPAMPAPVLRRFWELSNRMDYKDPEGR